METHWLCGKDKFPGAVVNQEGQADSILGYDRTYHCWFSLKKKKKMQQKAMLPIDKSFDKFTLFIEWPSYLFLLVLVPNALSFSLRGVVVKVRKCDVVVS